MEKIRIVIVEDEFVIAEDLRFSLEQNGYEVGAIFDKAEAARNYLISESPDVLLVDIHLAGTMDGIDLVRQLNEHMEIPVIYITANSDTPTYERARQTRPHSFLIKPFSAANLLASIDLALYNFSNERVPQSIERTHHGVPAADGEFLVNQCLFIRNQGKYKKVNSNDLLFIEAAGSYLHIQTKTEKYTQSQNLTQFLKKTPLPNLVRIHRSYIVNVNKIDSFEDSAVHIQQYRLPLSDNYRAEFLTRIHLI